MAARKCLLILLVLTSCFTIFTHPLTGQTTNRQALIWYKTALDAEDENSKIEAYLKAIEIDPNFVEALYNLGILYRKIKEFDMAEKYLNQAYNARPEFIKKEFKAQILYDLYTVFKIKGKLKEAEESLRGALFLTKKPSFLSKLYFELGRILYQQQKYEEALNYLNTGKKYDKKTRPYFDNLIKIINEEKELQKLYEAVQTAEQKGDLQGAKSLLQRIIEIRPGFKNAEHLLARIDSLLRIDAQDRELNNQYREALNYLEKGDLETAVVMLEKIAEISPDYKDVQSRLQQVRQQLKEKQKQEQLEKAYAEGLEAMSMKNWTKAIIALEQVLEIDPEFRDARKRLKQAQNSLEKESTESILAKYYTQGVEALQKEDLASALLAFEKIKKINSNYRNVKTLIKQIEDRLRIELAPARPVQKRLVSSTQLDSLYQLAVAYLNSQNWAEAIATLEKIQQLRENYKDTNAKLAFARSKMENSKTEESGLLAKISNKRLFYVASTFLALLILPIFGILIFSPTVRARFHFLRGNYLKAVQIYEQILARHPERLKLYPALANIYLLLGRNDDRAIKIYKTILQLNLSTHLRDEINNVVAQKYLKEGRTDADAIEILENVLKSEHRKLSGPK